jgi:hypothetical protein
VKERVRWSWNFRRWVQRDLRLVGLWRGGKWIVASGDMFSDMRGDA